MAKTNFNLGDIVKLKSGGPEMTITEILSKTPNMTGRPPQEREVNTVKTKWFDSTKLEFGQFREPELELVKQNPDPYFD